MLGPVIVTVEDLRKVIGDREILAPMSFTIHRGARIGIIGPNGSGKSTFLRILAGEDRDYEGKVTLAHGTRVGHVAQEPVLDEARTVREEAEAGLAHVHALLGRYDEIATRLGEISDPEESERLLARMGRLQEEIERIDGWEWEHRLEMAMEALRLPPPDRRIGSLSGGERRRVALCRELISAPDLLLLDEPTNHLDAATVEWLEVFLESYDGTVVAVTHDRYFLDNLAQYMVELENARLTIYEGNYSTYLERKAEILAVRRRTEDKRRRLLERELAWLNSTPAARRAKSKARVKNYERLASEEPLASPEPPVLVLPPGPRLGNKVLRVEDLAKAYGGQVLFDGLSFELRPGEILGITGPNGVGKTTLFRIILGQVEPDRGRVELGPTVTPTYVDQTRADLDPAKTVFEEVSGGLDVIRVGSREYRVREYLSGFQFKGSLQETPVGKLSGGERNRLLLAKTLRRGANLLLLDEPTNDLDLMTLRVLEEALEEFRGSALIISHDRFFLDRLANRLLIFEEPGRPRLFDGNYEAYFEVRRRELEESGKALGRYRKTSYRKIARR